MKPRTIMIAVAIGATLLGGTLPAFSAEPNDDFTGATTILSIPFRAEQNTQSASSEAGEPQACGNVGRTLWYRWTAPASFLVVADTRGSNFDTVLSIYEGTSPFSLDLVECDDDSLGAQSVIAFNAAEGATYYVQAGGKFSSGGEMVFNLARPATMSGTVVHAATLDPLSDICVDVFDADLHRKVGEGLTDLDGVYQIEDLPSIPVKVRFKDCADYGPEFQGRQSSYKTQWYLGKKTFALADPITLVGGTEVTNVDVALAERPRPDVAVTSVEVQDLPLQLGPAGEAPIETGTARRVVVQVENTGPVDPRWTRITADVCPRTIGSCKSLGARRVTLPSGNGATVSFEWNALDMVGDVTIVVIADLNEDGDWTNNIAELASFVHVGGTGFGAGLACDDSPFNALPACRI